MTLAHSSLLGVSVALWLNLYPLVGVSILGLVIALIVAQNDQGDIIGSDTVLGIISQATLAAYIISTSIVPFRVDLLGILYGDILSVTAAEVNLIFGLNALIILAILIFWRRFVSISLNPQLAKISGINIKLCNILYLLLLVAVIGVGMRLVGVLLITALLIMPWLVLDFN